MFVVSVLSLAQANLPDLDITLVYLNLSMPITLTLTCAALRWHGSACLTTLHACSQGCHWLQRADAGSRTELQCSTPACLLLAAANT